MVGVSGFSCVAGLSLLPVGACDESPAAFCGLSVGSLPAEISVQGVQCARRFRGPACDGACTHPCGT